MTAQSSNPLLTLQLKHFVLHFSLVHYLRYAKVLFTVARIAPNAN